MKKISLLGYAFAMMACSLGALATPKPQVDLRAGVERVESTNRKAAKPQRATAIFAGGCFWCMEPPFDKWAGVLATVSGYIGGHVDKPSYKQVSAGDTGHYEAVKVIYDPSVVSYEELLPLFWRNIDPLDDKGQFCDKGQSYLSAIFTQGPQQQQAAERSLQNLRVSGQLPGEIATKILPATEFFDAEEYHQNYYQKNPLRYRYYRSRCGRDERLEQLWK